MKEKLKLILQKLKGLFDVKPFLIHLEKISRIKPYLPLFLAILFVAIFLIIHIKHINYVKSESERLHQLVTTYEHDIKNAMLAKDELERVQVIFHSIQQKITKVSDKDNFIEFMKNEAERLNLELEIDGFVKNVEPTFYSVDVEGEIKKFVEFLTRCSVKGKYNDIIDFVTTMPLGEFLINLKTFRMQRTSEALNAEIQWKILCFDDETSK